MKPVIVTGGDKEGVLLASIGEYQQTIDRSEGDGPRSIELMLVGLGACTYDTVRHYMARKRLNLENLSVEINANPSEKGKYYDRIAVNLRVSDQISDKEKVVILNAAKTCRIHNTLEKNINILVEVTS